MSALSLSSSNAPAPARSPLQRVARIALTLILAGAFGLCLLTLTAFTSGTNWLLEITTHFRPHYAVGLLLCAILFTAVRRRRTALVFVAFAFANIGVLAPRFLPHRNTLSPATVLATAGAAQLKILVSNVLSDNRDYAALLNLIARENPDVIALVEVNDTWIRELAPLSEKYPHAVRVPRSDNFGIALFSRLPLSETKTLFLSSTDIPSVRAQVLVGQRPVHLLVTHPLPPGSASNLRIRDEQLAAIARWVASDSPSAATVNTPTIVVGDFNCAPWSPAFRRLLADGALNDTGHGLNPTWPVSPWWLRIPLDHCVVTRDFAIVEHRIGPSIGSDHFPIIVTLALPPTAP